MEIPASLLISSGRHAYVAVKASVHASYSAVFGLNDEERVAIVKRFHNSQKEVINGLLIKGSPIEIVNALSELGYRVVSTTGEAEIIIARKLYVAVRDEIMAHFNHSDCDHQCHISPTSGVHQTLDELDFERGLWFAAQHADMERLQKLLTQGTFVDVTDNSGYTALHYAARNGHVDVCNLLLRNRANVNAITKSGCASPLHRACSAGKIDVVKLLLRYNANVELKDSDGKTALHRGAEAQNVQICEIIVSLCPSLKYEKDLRDKLPIQYTEIEKLIDILK